MISIHTYTIDGLKITNSDYYGTNTYHIHNDAGPAQIVYNEKGNISALAWVTHNKKYKIFHFNNRNTTTFTFKVYWLDEDVYRCDFYTENLDISSQLWFYQCTHQRDPQLLGSSWREFINYIKQHMPLLCAKILKKESIHIFD